MAVSDEAASAAEPSAADAWFQRKMALHEAARRASANARQAGAVAEQKRLERTEEAVRRVDRELEWNRARVSALRARLETVIAPRRAARDARDPTAKHKSAPKPVFVSYARDAPFAERALVRAVVDAINQILPTGRSTNRTRKTRSSTCWHDDDDVPFSESRDWKHVQLCRVDAANGCDVFVVVGSPSYEKSAACALERAALRVRREPPEWGGDGHDGVVVVALDAAEACGLAGYGNENQNTHFRSCVREETRDVYVSADLDADPDDAPTKTAPRLRKRTRAFEDVVARRVAAAVREALIDAGSLTIDHESDDGLENGVRSGVQSGSLFSAFSASREERDEAMDAMRATSKIGGRRDARVSSLSSLKSETSSLKSDPPPCRWSVRRVAEWLRSLGGWTAPFAARFEAERTHGSILDALDAATARERFGAADARARAKLIEACAETFADPATVEARRDAGRDDEFEDDDLDRYVRYTRYTNTSRREGDERDDEDDERFEIGSFEMMSISSRARLARLRDALASCLLEKSRGAPTVAEDAAFDAVYETTGAFYAANACVTVYAVDDVRVADEGNAAPTRGTRLAPTRRDESAKESAKYDACLLACCDAFETRSGSAVGRVDVARFAAAAAATLHGELDDDAAKRRRRAVVELEALNDVSTAESPNESPTLTDFDHVTPLILRAALETKLRERGVFIGYAEVADERTNPKAGPTGDTDVWVLAAKLAVDDVVADGLMAGSAAAGARAAARVHGKQRHDVSLSSGRGIDDEVVSDMVRVAFASCQKKRADAAVRAAEARAAARAAASAAIDRRRDAFETSRALGARARALAAYETRLRAALSELAATDSCIEAFRGAVRLVETFAATNALVNGFDPSFDKGGNSFDKGGVGAYAGVLVPGAEARSRALRVVHASARSRRGVGDEMRAWEGDAWPSVGEARLAGPLDHARSNSARSNSENPSFPPRVVDGDDELVAPVFATSSRKSSDRDADPARDEDVFTYFSNVSLETFSNDDDGFSNDDDGSSTEAVPDVSETPPGFLALELGAAEDKNVSPETARRRRAVVLLAARAAGAALARFARARREDRDALRRAAREAFAADEASREARRASALEALEERRGS